MQLVPESIYSSSVIAMDSTWAKRLNVLRYGQLKIDFQNEVDTEKLEMWLEMFGISPQVLQLGLTTEEYRKLLQSVILIFKLSGTPKSIELMAKALGAVSTRPVYKYVLRYSGEILYNGDYQYDSGGMFRVTAITIEVTGVSVDKQSAFLTKMKKLFELFQPMWIYLEGIDFV